jgi:truncated hemoglobin YjbI
MTYVLVSVAAPLSVFPYLIVAGRFVPPDRMPLLFALSVAAANVAIALMTVVMTYGVAYHGVLMPDRVVKRSLIRYLIEGPLMASCVVGLILLLPPGDRILGLPRDAVIGMVVIGGIVFFQLLITLSRPLVDLLVYWGDWEEITWMRRLDDRMLSSTDLRQLLENILTALCDLLRVQNGFVAVMSNGELQLDTVCGSRAESEAFLKKCDLGTITKVSSLDEEQVHFIQQDGFWLLPLRGYDDRVTLGILGVQARGDPAELSEREQEAVAALVERAQLALEDRRLQQGVLGVLKQMAAEIESLQRIRGTIRYLGSPPLEPLESNPVLSPDFASWVKDALTHYWGGPKLTESPLLRLRIVRRALEENDYNPAKAMRSVLDQAIERLRPEGQRSMTASEWLLYNILELRFIRGLRVGDVARRLAMSESDLYRKQRVAIDEVAKQLASMEEHQGE